MDFHLLGPLEVTDGDRVVPVGGGKPRALLAALLLHPNEVVSSDRLIDALWGDAPPASAAKNVQLYVFQLRKTLRAGTVPNSADAILETRAGGYVVRLDRSQRDVDRFEHKLEEGRRALADGDRAEAGRILREALALWRGPALAEFRYQPFAQDAITRLEELRVGALEERIESDLALGRHSDVVGELQTLVAQHPLRERLRGQLMLALYRCNRQAEALDAYRDGRRRLVDELGLEPSTTLRDLERAILTGSAELSVPSPQAGVAARRRLPSLPNRTVGRARELGEIADRLRAESVRLLTLTGPGGVGKTRLALDAARTVEADFADGARWVSLAALSRAGAVAGEIARAVGAKSLVGESDAEAVQRFLAAKHLLLVVDNFEHVVDEAPGIAKLLEACPEVTVLATSRERLDLSAEELYPVPSLDLPHGTEGLSELKRIAAVALFTDRAAARDPSFQLDVGTAPVVAEICRRLDGLPLAIELAAARSGLLSPTEIARRLDDGLGALGKAPRDAPARQTTLRATIDWSHELLGEPERQAFARFAVFSGVASLEAVEAITGADLDTLDSLTAKSLLTRRVGHDDESRLGMLETIRAFAVERFAAGDEQEVRSRHFSWFLSLARRHGAERAIWSATRREHLARLETDRDNMHAALGWAVTARRAEPALAMCAALGCFWEMRDHTAA